jgi:hypothetical protein
MKVIMSFIYEGCEQKWVKTVQLKKQISNNFPK